MIEIDKAARVYEHGLLVELEEGLHLASMSEDKEAAQCEVIASFFGQHYMTRCALNIAKRYGFTLSEINALTGLEDKPQWLGFAFA